MKSLTWRKDAFLRDGKPYFLISGEIPYFRVPKKEWRRRIRLFKEAGGNAVSTYMPWLLHEPEEGRFVFEGKDYLEIGTFLTICEEEKIGVILRPGPYQYTEMRYEGLPGWLGRNYPEILAKNLDGSTHGISHVSYTHPVFLEKARRWYKAVADVIRPHTAENGGCVIAIQLDNETMGIHHWFNGQWNEYNPETHGFGREDGAWPTYLKEKYKSVPALNRAWGTALSSFAEALPICRKASDLPTACRNRDYDDYYYRSIADYFGKLASWLTEDGISLPAIHNAPGTDSIAEFYDAADRLGDRFLLGSDLYYCLGQEWNQNNPTPKYAIWCFVAHEVIRNMGMPSLVLEMPSGSCSDYPPILPEDAEAAYLCNAAMGMRGLNYYIFTGGPNPPDSGTTGDVYDFQAPISADGKVRPLYETQKRFNGILNEMSLAGSRMLFDFTVGYDRMINRAWHWGTAFGEEGALRPADVWQTLRTGVLTTAFLSGRTPSLCDLDRNDPALDKPLWIVGSRVMSRAAQERVVSFLSRGGRLIIGPTIPERDENLTPCTLLSNYLGIAGQPSPFGGVPFPQVDADDIANIPGNRGLWYWESKENDTVLLRERHSGKTIALERRLNSGSVILLGLNWSHSVTQHGELLSRLLDRSGNEVPVLTKTNPNLFAVLRETTDRDRILFVMNLYSAPQKTDISVGDRCLKDLFLKPMEVRVIRL